MVIRVGAVFTRVCVPTRHTVASRLAKPWRVPSIRRAGTGGPSFDSETERNTFTEGRRNACPRDLAVRRGGGRFSIAITPRRGYTLILASSLSQFVSIPILWG